MATSIQDTFNAPFVFRTGWDSAFEDEEFVKVFASDILENYILKKRYRQKLESGYVTQYFTYYRPQEGIEEAFVIQELT